jgi:uncharacterized protein (DUF1800 family)
MKGLYSTAVVSILALLLSGCGGGAGGNSSLQPPGVTPPSPPPPPPPPTAAAAARFLEQTSFGPTPETVAHIKSVGFDAYLQEQFGAAPSSWPDPLPTDMDLSRLQKQFFLNAVSGQDQLRQRVAFALLQTFVISGRKVGDTHAFVPYLRMLSNDAFGNYRTLLNDVTLSPAMGRYLDMVDNEKADPVQNTSPNENYAREIMQLFSIGTVQLNLDGTISKDAKGNPIPTYTQDTVEGFAHLFTGWTFPTTPGQTSQPHNPEYYNGQMESHPDFHDTGAKAILNGVVLPAGQTPDQDLKAGLDNIFNHPNVGPFIGTRLIRQLVTSNPSPAYVQRVATVFNDNGQGVRGDLKAVVRAILLDPEARRGDVAGQGQPTDAHLKEPALYVAGVLRALHAQTDGSVLNDYTSSMRQDVFNPPTVFNYYPPNYKTLATQVYGPEFKLQVTPTALARANFINDILNGFVTNTTVDLTPWSNVAADPAALVALMNEQLMHGAMSDQMKQAITTAVASVGANDLAGRAGAGLYLTLTSSQYQVHH